MPPADGTPDVISPSFELVYCVKAYNKIPVYEFKSKRTGLEVVIAEVNGPVVDGFFTLATETFDDDGLPHTLEHLIFLGSELYPYKGVLDLLANRCLASGTNAWTDVDHTCYTIETAGDEGFLSLLPIYVDHILYPILSDEAFLTEVHHITGSGEDAGVVYCEIQGCENSAESRMHVAMQHKIYPGVCGYSSRTGGVMKNLRESTSNEKVKNYHKMYYRPENLKLIIVGKVKPEDVFRALQPVEEKIVAKGDRGPFTKPWQSSCPPVEKSVDLVVKYPSDDESNGIVNICWRGPSIITDLYNMSACTILLKYLTDNSVSPLQKEFVEIEDAFASTVSYNVIENSESCLYLNFKGVPKDKLPLIKPKLDNILKQIVDHNDIDMKRLKSIIKRQKLEDLSSLESNPCSAVAYLIIGHMLYGTSKEHLEQRMNPIVDLEKMNEEPKSYWIDLLKKWCVENIVVSIQGVPSIEEQQNMAIEEKTRIEAQIERLTKAGLDEKEEGLLKAIENNEKTPSHDMLICVPIPSTKSISFHDVARYSSSSIGKHIDLSETPVFTYFDHLKSSFVYMFALMDTSSVTPELRNYIPLLLETLLESPLERDGVLIPHEEVIAQLEEDTVATGHEIGFGSSGRFNVGLYAHTVSIDIQVEPEKYHRGIIWLRELLYQTKLTTERIKIITNKIINAAPNTKRKGRSMIRYLMRSLCYIPDSNQRAGGVFQQHKFLTQVAEKLNSDQANEIIQTLEYLRGLLTDPSNIVLYFAADLENLGSNAAKLIQDFITPEINIIPQQNRLNVTPDWKLLAPDNAQSPSHCIVGMGCLESTEFQQTTRCINHYEDPDMPAILLFAQYLTQTEGPLWKHIRGKGYAYGYTILLKVHEGLLYLAFSSATNVVGAYKEASKIISKQIATKEWEQTLFESAKSSLIYELIQNESSIGSVVLHSLQTYFFEVNYEYYRTLLGLISDLTVEDLNRVGEKYFSPLIDPKRVKTAIVCDPSKAEEIASEFKQFGLDLTVYPSLEESFLAN